MDENSFNLADTSVLVTVTQGPRVRIQYVKLLLIIAMIIYMPRRTLWYSHCLATKKSGFLNHLSLVIKHPLIDPL